MTGQAAYALKALQAIVVGVRFSARSVRETIFTPQVERSILVDSERREKMHGSQRSKKGRGTGIEEEMTTNKFGNHREKERERQRQRQIQRQRASENEIFILGESLVGKFPFAWTTHKTTQFLWNDSLPQVPGIPQCECYKLTKQ